MTGQVVPLDDLDNYNVEKEFFDQLFDIQARLHKLELCVEENCILAALCVVFTGKLLNNFQFFLYCCYGLLFATKNLSFFRNYNNKNQFFCSFVIYLICKMTV